MDNFNVKINLPGGKTVEESITSKTTLKTLADKYADSFDFPVLGAICCNKITELSSEVPNGASVEFFTIRDSNGRPFFIRSVIFVLIKAVNEMFPHSQVHIEYSIGNGYYCFFQGLDWIKTEEVEELERRMKDIIAEDMPFIHKKVPREEAIKLFYAAGMYDKVKLFSFRKEDPCSVYMLGDLIDYFYGQLAYSTGALHNFKLTYYNKGIILLIPDSKDPSKIPSFQDSPKFFNIIKENNTWLDILDLDNCGQLNEAVRQGRTNEIILIAESLHEKKLALIADEIHRRKEAIKIIAIAGPSSSGKTTTALRLSIQLKVNGFKPFPISLDNYFVDRDKTPLDESGMHDYEGIDAIDVRLFNEQLRDLLAGHEMPLQRYDFKTGTTGLSSEKFMLPEKGIIIVEGIHGLNPKLFFDIPHRNIYKIYVSALAQLNIDHHNRIPTTDCRLLRRIVRDAQFRGHDANETLKRWPSVRAGEEHNIFPYQERADIMFNSSLVYELAVLKKYAEPYLRKIAQDKREFIEAKRLLKFLSFFENMDDTHIPYNSLIREFIGGSIFSY